MHVYDAFGSEIKTVTCSGHLSESACRDTNASSIVYRPTDPYYIQRASGRAMTADGLFVDSEWGLFQNGSGAAQYTTLVVESRDIHGNPTRTRDRHGVAGYDGFGRPYFEGHADGSWSRTERRWCAAFTGGFGGNRVTCPSGAVYRERVWASIGSSAWTYFDVLGREVLAVKQGLLAGRYSAVKKTYDAQGRISTVSEPYETFDPSTTSVGLANAVAIYRTTTQYDEFGRVVLTTHPNSVSNAISETRVVPQGRNVETYLPRNRNGVNQRTLRVVNGLGEVVQVVDHLGSVLNFTYDAVGNVLTATRSTYDGKVATTSATYDALGRKITSSDPDKGSATYSYNALGELVVKTATGSCEKVYNDAAGRPYARRNYSNASCTGTVETTTDWTYDAAAFGLGAVYHVAHNDNVTSYFRTHDYDAFGRPSRIVTTLGGSDYITTSTYDEYGRPFQTFFEGTNIPRSGELLQYNARGFMTTLRNAFPGTTGQVYHEVLDADAAGRPTSERRYGSSNLVTERKYQDSTGRAEWIKTGGGTLQNLAYAYDPLGNLVSRTDTSGGSYLREDFDYDSLQRLTSTYATPASGPPIYTLNASYDGFGNNSAHTIGTKPASCNAAEEVQPGPGAVSASGTSSFCYDARGNQLRTVSRTGGEFRRLTYSSYDLAREVRSNVAVSPHVTQYAYGPERQMILRSDYATSTPTGTPQQTFYAGGAEIILKPGTTNREVRRTLAGIVITQTVDNAGGIVAQNVDVLLTDVLGSTHRLTDTNGVIRSGSGNQFFTAFGQRGDAATGSPLADSSRFNFDDLRTREGFTGHQQMDATGLIHMGARLYDPVLARFIQADSIVPDGGDLQSLNRYTYVSNNPLAYTDPTGHWGAQQQGYLRTTVAIAIAVYTGGAVAPAAVPGGTGVFFGMTVTSSNAGMVVMAGGFAAGAVQTGTLRGATTGAFSAVVSFGIGNAYLGKQMNAALTAQRALAHAAAGGFTEAINGGNFGHGFVSVGMSVTFEPMIDTGSKAADATLHAMVGGTASELSGGKFANGAMTALVSYAFNQMAHKITRSEMMKRQVASAKFEDYDTSDPTFHDYKFSSRLCTQGPGCEVSNLALLANPDSAPRFGSMVEGYNVLYLNNPIYHATYFDASGDFYMINMTDAAHDFHAGAVVSRLTAMAGGVYLETHGFGYSASTAARYFNYLAGYGYFAYWQTRMTMTAKIESGQFDPRALK
jgi:RHS repeat-associated protein